MERRFNKKLPTIVTLEGNHYLVNENGKIGGQIKSIVTDDAMQSPIAEISFEINICATLEDAMKKYNE